MPVSDLISDPLLKDVPEREGYKVLGGVVLYQKLGQGGMGAVYRGKHLRLEVDVALKVMATPAGLHPDQAANYLQRFLREAKTSASVKHSNLIRVYDVNSEGGVHFLIMDFIDGESAGDRLKRKGRLSEQEAVEIALGAAEGLAAAHESGVVHRDVKPDNILIDKKGNTVVADLGLAKAFGGESDSALSMGLSLTQQAMGTPYYMSPEQTRSAKDVGPQADVWSLGVTLYQLASAKLPWSETDITDLIYGIRNNPAPGVKTHCSELSDGLCAIIEKAMQKEPAERYADCAEMAAALTDHLDAISTSRKSVLPDAEAGQTKMALVTLTPPPSKTLTLIGKSLLRPSDSERLTVPEPVAAPAAAPADTTPTARAEAPPPIRAGLPGWVVPAVIAGALIVIALIVGLTWSLARGPGPSAPAPVAQAEADPLEAEALDFYESELEEIAAEHFADVVTAIDATEGRYERTSYGVRITKLRERAAKVMEGRAREEEERMQAAFEAAVAAADEAEEAGDLAEAVRQLKLALDAREDPATRERLASLERRMELDRLLAEAAAHAEAGELERAAANYREALEFADGGSRELVLTRLAEVEKRAKAEKAVAVIRREADAGRWRVAWDRIVAAKKAEIDDPRLEGLSRKAVEALAPPVTLTGPLGVELVLVSGGVFPMGSEAGAEKERPVRQIRSNSFYVGRTEVTRAQFEAYRRGLRAVGDDSSDDSRKPAASMTWDEAVAFCGYLTSIGGNRVTYRLPTEAEWEYAARGPEGREYPWGDAPPGPEHANVAGEDDGFDGLAPVGSFPRGATPRGIMDLSGNVAEWCADWYGPYSPTETVNPTGPAAGRSRVVRGGSFDLRKMYVRGAARSGRRPDNAGAFIGFRVVRELSAEEAAFHERARDENP